MNANRTESAAGANAGFLKGAAQTILLAVAAFTLVTCENQDPLAPEGSTIKVSANPQTIVVTSGGAPGSSTVTATVRGKNGVRLPDQEVTFSTTEGTLAPPAETPLVTDDQGQVSSTLTTGKTATVTAQSGAIIGTTTVSTVAGDIGSILLNATPQNLNLCSNFVAIEAVVTDTGGSPLGNITIEFTDDLADNASNLLPGNFTRVQDTTDPNGRVTTRFDPLENECVRLCSPTSGDPNIPFSHVCRVAITAGEISGSVFSQPITISESVP